MIQSRKDTPPYPTHQRSTAYRCQRARTLHQHRNALCITRNMNVIIPPHETMIYVVKNAQKHAVPMGKAHKKVRVYRSTEPPTKVPTMMTGHSTSSSSSATHRAPFNPLINHHFPSKNWPCYRDIPLKKTCLSLNMFNHVYL